MQYQQRIALGTPRIEWRGAKTIAGIRDHYSTQGFYFAMVPAQHRRMEAQLGGVSDRIGSSRYQLLWGRSEDTDGFDYFVGVEVAAGSWLPDDFTRVQLPARRYAIFGSLGAASPSDIARAIWFDWLPTSGYEPAGDPHVIEIVDARNDPARGIGDYETWVPLKDERPDVRRITASGNGGIR